MSTELRPPRRDDLAKVAAFLQSTAEEDGIGGANAEELEQWFTIPGFDAESDARIALADGRIVGYADVTAEEGDRGHVWLDARGDASALIDWGEQRARELVAAPTVRVQVWSEDVARRGLFESRGYDPIRHNFEMQIDFEGMPDPPAWPEGTSVRTFEPGRDDRALYDLHTDAFADAWEFEQASYERWRHWHVDRPDFDASLCLLSQEGGVLTGFALCRTSYADHDGWVNLLGVRRAWRRRGLGMALLRHSFVELWNREAREVGLGVDAASLTGATRLYERAGMRIIKQFTTFERSL